MDLNLIKVLGNLLSDMTITEAVSLLSMLGGALWVAIKSALRFNEYIQKSRAPAPISNITPANDAMHEQILIQLQLTKDKLIGIESKIDDQNFSMPKELATELAHMYKKLEDIHNEHVTAHKDIGKTVIDNLDNIAVMKEKIINIENSIPRIKADIKESLKEVQVKVEATADKMAVLQGTLIGNLNTRSSR